MGQKVYLRTFLENNKTCADFTNHPLAAEVKQKE